MLQSLTQPQNGQQCLVGTVAVNPTGLIGATNAFLIVQNTAIPLRQVPGPSLRGVSLDRLNGRTAVVCGNFIQDTTGVVLNVTTAVPVPSGLGTGLGTGLGASL